MEKFSIEFHGEEAKIYLKDHQKRMSNLRPFFINFYTYMTSVLTGMFIRLKSGGRDRGVTWSWFAPQYARADGTVVPAEGTRGVQGRLRPSGKRVTRRSNLMRDTGRMQSGLLDVRRSSKKKLIMDSSVQYTGYQNQLRPFQFFEYPKDYRIAEAMARKYIYG